MQRVILRAPYSMPSDYDLRCRLFRVSAHLSHHWWLLTVTMQLFFGRWEVVGVEDHVNRFLVMLESSVGRWRVIIVEYQVNRVVSSFESPLKVDHWILSLRAIVSQSYCGLYFRNDPIPFLRQEPMQRNLPRERQKVGRAWWPSLSMGETVELYLTFVMSAYIWHSRFIGSPIVRL